MKNKPEDRPKIIALGVGIAALFAYILFSLVPRIITAQSNSKVAEKAAAETPTNTVPPPPIPAGGQPTSGTPNAQPIAAMEDPNEFYHTGAKEVVKSGRVDPFKAPSPIRNPDQHISKPPPKPAPVVTQHQPVEPPQRNGMTSLPGMGRPQNLVQGGPTHSTPDVVLPLPPPPPVELKGVITGDTPVAVINFNGETLHKQKGDLLAEGLKITRISEEGIVLSYNDKSYSIAVGRTLNTQPKQKFNISSLPNNGTTNQR